MRLTLHAIARAVVISILVVVHAYAQRANGPERFRTEVKKMLARPVPAGGQIVLFTGSSSIRMWGDISNYFPNYAIVNRGFGGSQTSDLLYFADDIIFTLKPSKIFIYEGDNDLAGGKSSAEIMATTDSLLQRIRKQLPATVPVYFISPKPSVARWNLKDAYLEHSANLEKWTATKENVYYVDGWSSLVDAKGEVLTDVFLKDNLHLNKKGYDLWSSGIRKFLP